ASRTTITSGRSKIADFCSRRHPNAHDIAHLRPSIPEMRCSSVTSNPAGLSSVMNSKGGSGSATWRRWG
ncbi:MAG: hypothetical protein WCD69_17830, partial [Xanthobacteraceae bacterium]